MCVYRKFLCVIIGSHNLLIPRCYMYMPDEVFHDWKSIRIKEEKKKTSGFYLTVSFTSEDKYAMNEG